jgi:hypothetical protein
MKKMNSLSFPMKWDFLFGRKLLRVALFAVCAFFFVQANAQQVIPLPPMVQPEAAAQKLLPEIATLKANPILVNNMVKDPQYNFLNTKLYCYTHVKEDVLIGMPTDEVVNTRFLELIEQGKITGPTSNPGSTSAGLSVSPGFVTSYGNTPQDCPNNPSQMQYYTPLLEDLVKLLAK